GEYFAKVDATESTVQAADVGEQVVHLPVGHRLTGCPATAVFLVSQALGLEQLYVIGVDGHSISPGMKNPLGGGCLVLVQGQGSGSSSGTGGGATVNSRRVMS